MASHPALLLHTPVAVALKSFFTQLEDRLELDRAVQVYLAGGMAAHLYTAQRMTEDIDAEFSARLALPQDLVVETTLEDGSPQLIYLDTNYNSSFALMHEDYTQDAVPVDFGLKWLQVNVLSPVDLAVSKIARWADNDRDDIAALARAGLINAEQLERRANDAIDLAGYVGNINMLRLNVRDAVTLAKSMKVDS
jgi:Nucleotidyltransferase of unknown function (DUF6036)